MAISEDLFTSELRSLEVLLPTLVQTTNIMSGGLWAMQLDLVRLQRRWMDAIRNCKSSREPHLNEIARLTSERPEAWSGAVQAEQNALKEIGQRAATYEHLYNLSREFGNALGWRLLNSNLRYILPLTINQENPPLPEGVALESILNIAKMLNAKEWGFPFLHDVSRSFSIGDISFVRSTADPITVEVKSHVVAELENEREVEVTVHAVMGKEGAEVVKKMVIEKPPGESTTVVPRTLDSRHRRQIERMNEAKDTQLLPDGYSKKKNGRRQIIMTLTEDGLSDRHWSVAERVLLDAKKHGSACEAVDGAIAYVALYSPAGLARPGTTGFDSSCLNDVPRMLSQSGIFLEDRRENALRFGTSAEHLDGKLRSDVMPLFIHPIQPELVLDLARGDLLMLVFINLGAVKKKLRDAGLNAFMIRDPENKSKEHLVIVQNVDMPDGRKGRITHGGLERYLKQMELDYLSVDSFVKMTVSSINRMRAEVPAAVQKDRGNGEPSKQTEHQPAE